MAETVTYFATLFIFVEGEGKGGGVGWAGGRGLRQAFCRGDRGLVSCVLEISWQQK